MLGQGAAAAQHHLSELINLGMFAPVSEVLVMFLIKATSVVGNWGIAIILLTICVRMLLFPLTWKQIKSDGRDAQAEARDRRDQPQVQGRRAAEAGRDDGAVARTA